MAEKTAPIKAAAAAQAAMLMNRAHEGVLSLPTPKGGGYSPSAAPSEPKNMAASVSDRRRAVMVSPGGAQLAPSLRPRHLTPRPEGDRSGRLLCRFQKRAEIFEFCDQSVLDGDHAVGALTLALEVRPVTSRTLLLGGEIGLQRCDARLECGDRIGHRLVPP